MEVFALAVPCVMDVRASDIQAGTPLSGDARRADYSLPVFVLGMHTVSPFRVLKVDIVVHAIFAPRAKPANGQGAVRLVALGFESGAKTMFASV